MKPSDNELAQRSLFALENAREIARQRREQKQEGLTPKTFQGVDADQGQMILADAIGGNANTNQQGSLSNAAIAAGKTVSSYGWETADWKPTISDPNGEDISLDDNKDGFDGQGQQPTDPLPPRCQCVNVWARGTPNRPPSDDDKLDVDPIPGVIDYEFFNVTSEEWLETSRNVFSPFSLVRYGEDSPSCEGNSQGGCIVAEWDGGAQQVTGTAFPDLARNLSIRDLEFTPDIGYVEPTDGPPSGTDPGDWHAVKVCNPPARTETQISGDRKLLKVFDADDRLVATLGYEKDDRLDVYTRCEEEGPPA